MWDKTIFCLGRDGLVRADMNNVLTLPSGYQRRASDGCASIGQYRTMTERDGEDMQSIQQEYQALQVIIK